MVFTIDEIRNYLSAQPNLKAAIENLSEDNIISKIEDVNSLNYVRNDANLEKYEAAIGLKKLKDHQRTLYRNTDGVKGKTWMALSPKWADPVFKKRLKTKYDIAYWVNYGDGEDVYGWFSVEDIEKWLSDQKLKLSSLQK